MVPTWTLLAALAAGLILGTLGSRVLFRPAAVIAPRPGRVADAGAAGAEQRAHAASFA